MNNKEIGKNCHPTQKEGYLDFDEYIRQGEPNLATPSSTEQAQDKLRTSAGQVQDKLHTDNYNIISIIRVIKSHQLSVKEIMTGLNLKGRDNFLNLYLTPAIAEGFVRLLYPDKPRHPRQKYLLTAKGITLYKEIGE